MSDWIKCTDKLPDIGQEVLVYRPDAPSSNDPLIRTAVYHSAKYGGRAFDCFVQPSHWQPLPAPPKP